MWKSIDDAAVHFGVSRRTLERRIDATPTKVDSKMNGSRRLVWCSDTPAPETGNEIVLTLQRQVATLQEKLEKEQEFNRELTLKMSEERERHDQLMAMAQKEQMGILTKNSQLLLEASQKNFLSRFLSSFKLVKG